MKTVATLPRPITDYQALLPKNSSNGPSGGQTTLGDRVMILGHNYQRDEVIQHADFEATP